MQEDKNAIFQMRFPQKLWYLLNLRTDAILWGGTGRTILLNYRILHNYLQCDHSIFKTANISSFVRQLNLYGFRKVTSHLQDPLCNSSNPYMHEYVHDYFQYGRPELLNKITRKALTMKKNFKPKNMYGNIEQNLYTSPLQKARHALRVALKKAAQDLFMQHSPRPLFKLESDGISDGGDDYGDEENIDIDWFLKKKDNIETAMQLDPAISPVADNTIKNLNSTNATADSGNFGDTTNESLISFHEESCQQATDSFPNQFLSMPDLDTEPTVDNSGVELLAQFDIEHDNDHGITKKLSNKENDHNSLNCVLPSISNDHNDDVNEKNADDSGYYHGEWDQMFNDMIAKGPNQECSSGLKELYSQISCTIDLLNS